MTKPTSPQPADVSETGCDRRGFLTSALGAGALSAGIGAGLGGRSAFAEVATTPLSGYAADEPASPPNKRFWFSVKSGMINDPSAKSWADKFQLLKDLGYDGVEYDQGLDANAQEIAEASAKVGLPVQGLVNPYHWSTRLSDPDEAVREKAVQNMVKALRFAKTVGASTVLLVPAKVGDPKTENAEQAKERSIAGIRRVIPLAAELGVRIGIENVWNSFLYVHNGPPDQTADPYVQYVDEINSAWVGIYFDFSNHRKYGNPAAWLRTMGSRVIKCDTKDFDIKNNKFTDVGDGDVPWAEVRDACKAVNYYGWVSSEVGGGDRKRLAKVLADLKKVLF